jgi:hypothetical protein
VLQADLLGSGPTPELFPKRLPIISERCSVHIERVKVRQEGMRTVRVSRELFVEAPYHIHSDPTLLRAWVESLELGGDPIEYWTPHGLPDIEVIRTTVIEEDPLVQYERSLRGNDEY